jgi:GntR family transcriptional regulator of arabinose operon
MARSVAVYIPVREYILRMIRSGELREGDPVETEESLTERFGISRRSVRAAVQELVNNGYLYKIQGKGTFVTSFELRHGLSGRCLPMRVMVVLGEMEAASLISPYNQDFIGGIGTEAINKGHSLTYAERRRDVSPLLASYEKDACGGIIWLRADKPYLETVRKLDSLGIPQVLINREEDGVCSVSTDEESAFLDIAGFLTGMGHRRIAMINAPSSEPIYHRRGEFFMEGMAAGGLPPRDTILLNSGEVADVKSLDRIFRGPNHPTALILGGHLLFCHYLPWLSTQNIPDDLSVLCYNDSAEAATFKTPVSAFCDPRFEIGRRAMDMLELLKMGRVRKGERRRVRGQIIARRSCALPGFLRERGKAAAPSPAI